MHESTHPLDMPSRMYPSAAPSTGADRPTGPAAGARSTQDLAAALYGEPAPVPTRSESTDTSPARTRDEIAAEMYGPKEPSEVAAGIAKAIPAAVLEERKARAGQAERMYPNQVDPTIESVLQEGNGLSKGDRLAVGVELTAMSRDLGLGSDDLRELVQRIPTARALTAEAAHDGVAQALVEAFGDKAHEAFEAARALVARDPRTARFLEATGLGNDAQTIVKLARSAIQRRAAR